MTLKEKHQNAYRSAVYSMSVALELGGHYESYEKTRRVGAFLIYIEWAIGHKIE